MSDTPRTDAKMDSLKGGSSWLDYFYVLEEFARTLERELATKEEQLAYAVEMRDGYRKAGNELIADRDATIARLREALEAAAESFNCIAGAAITQDTKACMSRAIGSLDRARAALAELS